MKKIFVGLLLLVAGCKSHQKPTHEEVLKSDSQNLNQESTAQDNSDTTKNYFLGQDLKQFNGFYTSMEMSGGKIRVENLPDTIQKIKSDSIFSTSIYFFDTRKNGYLLLFTLEYSNQSRLVVSTLTNNYKLIDFKDYINGYNGRKAQNDTIAMPTFLENKIKISFMRPDSTDMPSDAIAQEILLIEDNLKLKKINEF